MNYFGQKIDTLSKKAKRDSLRLAAMSTEEKNRILLEMSREIQSHEESILHANLRDQEAAQPLVESGEMNGALLKRLVLTKEKIQQLSHYLEKVVELPEPIQQQQFAMRLADGLELYRYTYPIGVIAVIFESRPEVVVQVSALTLKSGNAAILKGGREAAHTNQILFEMIQKILNRFQISAAVNLIETREDVQELITQDRYIDLIIPRGSNEFVRSIQDNSRIPVIGHSSGICHMYIDAEVDQSMVIPLVCDAKVDYPAACNALETLLIHQQTAGLLIPELLPKLQNLGIELRCCAKSKSLSENSGIATLNATEEDWQTEYLDLILAVKIVESVEEAIEHINQYGSHHTDTIVSTNPRTAEKFMNQVDSGCVFHNVSTRFSDGFVFGLGAEVGISTNKTHARGPVGLEGLVTYKYHLKGKGQVKHDFSRPDSFLHEPIQ